MTDSLILNKLRSGCVIPAHPLALKADNQIDERHQKALTRYYLAAGAICHPRGKGRIVSSSAGIGD